MLGAILVGLLIQSTSVDKDRVFVADGFMTGEQYLKVTETQRAAYAMGFINGLLASPMMAKDAERPAHELQMCLKEHTNTQIAEIIRRYINDRPQRWHEGLNI